MERRRADSALDAPQARLRQWNERPPISWNLEPSRYQVDAECISIPHGLSRPVRRRLRMCMESEQKRRRSSI